MTNESDCLYVCIENMHYDPVRPLIEHFRLTVPNAAVVSIMGPSGCGKTTLLRILAGFEKRYVGDVILGQRPITNPASHIQLVFQDARLLPWLDVQTNAAMSAQFRITDAVSAALESVELGTRRFALPKELSGGEETRVALARALASNPALLLLDEPFKALDMQLRWRVAARVREWLREREVTAVMVSHSVEDAVLMSDTIYVVSKSPMRITERIDVPLPYPRAVADADVRRRIDAVVRAICR